MGEKAVIRVVFRIAVLRCFDTPDESVMLRVTKGFKWYTIWYNNILS